MKPWLRWSLLTLFLSAMVIIQFIPGEGEPAPAGEPSKESEEP
ncbi:MAG: hypothetical protein AAF933_01620 [Pseudomonadota bacterium]